MLSSSGDEGGADASGGQTGRRLVLAFGNNHEGQCGVAGEEGVLAAPTPVTATADMDYSVLSASCSLRQSFFVTASHLLVSAGENEHGELGRTGKRNHFLQLDMLSKYQVREVAAGNGFSHACTADGRVISWGRNELGQLGDGDRDRKERPRVNSNFSEGVIQVSAGDAHCIALTKGGGVLTWGGNRKGQLGDGQLTSSCVPRLNALLRHRPVVGVCAGGNHCIAFTATGNAYVWGDGAQGQLGLGDTSFRAYPTLLRSLRSAKVCGVSAGLAHSAAVSPNGLLFTWGSNANGQLGIDQPEVKLQLAPAAVDRLRECFCLQVACGSGHTLVVCRRANGAAALFGMGLNSSGQVGVGAGNAVHTPTLVPLEEGFSPRAVSSGCLALHSFVFSQGVPIQRATLPRIDLATLASLATAASTSSQALQTLREHVVAAFSSISVLNASFGRSAASSDILTYANSTECPANLEAVRQAYSLLLNTKNDSVLSALGRASLKLTENLKDCPHDDIENLTCFLIVLENPLLLNPQAFHVGVERVVTGILALPPSSRSTLFGWLRSYDSEYFGRVVSVMNAYLSFALAAHLDASPATLVLNSLYECNHSSAEPIVSDEAFANPSLEAIDVIAEYDAYIRNMSENVSNSVFNFCRYSFLLPINMKRKLLAYDVNKSIFNSMSYFATSILGKHFTEIPRFVGMSRGSDNVLDLGTTHLALTVRRDRVLFDLLVCVREVIREGHVRALELPLRVTFADEGAVDQGGVSKEMFAICIAQVVNSMPRCAEDRFVWFDKHWGLFDNTDSSSNGTATHAAESDGVPEYHELNEELKQSNQSAFYFGIIVGLALYNRVLIDLPLPPCVFRRIFTAADFTLHDLCETDYALGKAYFDLLKYSGSDGDISEVFGVDFTASANPLINSKEVINLLPNGSDIDVTYGNRKQYVDLMIQHTLYGCCKADIDAFVRGLKILTGGMQSLQFCSCIEFEHLCCGTKDINTDDLSLLRIHTTYKGVFNDEHPIVNWFWDILHSLSPALKRKFIEFVSGSDRLPIEGISKLSLIIQSVDRDSASIPTSHTCFNVLELSHAYESSDRLREKLLTALEHSRGFGFA